jgi:macrolide transport system ATP-binding/permease protein
MTARELARRVRALFGRRQGDHHTQEEMRFHVEMEVEAGLRRGLSRAEAERGARLRLGSVDASMEAARDERGFPWLNGLALDMRQAWIALRRRPGYLLVASAALISAVVVNTLVFTVLYGVLLKPLPYSEPDRLARLFEASTTQPKFPLSIYHYQENRRYSQTLDGQALYTGADMQLIHGERAEMVTAVAITEGLLPLLGASPVLGRNFVAAEMVESARVVILSHAFWKSRFNADPTIVGKTLRLNRENWTVIGIAPPGLEHVGGSYRSPLQGDTVTIWRPLALDIEEGCLKGCHYTNAIVRLKPGITLTAAEQDLNRIMRALSQRFPDFYSGTAARLEPLSQEVVGGSRRTILVIAALGALVLLLACVNVAGLSIARALARRRELAVRLALGGSRAQIVRAILSENVMLALLAAALGIGVAAALLPLLRAALPADFPRVHDIVFRWPSAMFAIAAAIGTSTLAGLVAALRQETARPGNALHEDARTASGSGRTVRLRGTLVAGQMACACILCFAATLLLRSSIAVSDRDHGFDPASVLTFELSLPFNAYDDERAVAFYGEARRRIGAIAGVRSVGFATSLPWTGYDENSSFSIPGYTPRKGVSLSARYQAASAGLFEALERPLLKGRTISDDDDARAPEVVVINDTLARRYFPEGDAIGRMVEVFGARRRIVGVVADIRDWPADLNAQPALWMSLAQAPFRQVRVAIRTDQEPSTLVPAVRATLASLDPELPIAGIRNLSDIADAALAERRFALWWSETFAGLALVLAALGIYALLTYSVQQRRREIAIRMALGATRMHVARRVVTGGLSLAVVGAGAGILIAPAVGRALASLLYAVSPTDAFALLAAPVALVFLTTVACVVPAWTAARAEPMSALRDQ